MCFRLCIKLGQTVVDPRVPRTGISSDKMVLVLLRGVSVHGLYRSTAKENHRLCLIEATVREEIQCNTTCKNLR